MPRRLIKKAPVLAYPDFVKKDFIIFVDGSKEGGFGEALHQKDASGM